MSTTGLSQIDHAVHVTNAWLGDLMVIMDWTDRARAYHALRAVLPSLRDHLPAAEAADLAAQLPLIVRGIFFEGWRPEATRTPDRSGAEFIERVAHAFLQTPDVDAQTIVAAVLLLLERHVSPGEIAQVFDALPEGVRKYWPSASFRSRAPGRAYVVGIN